MLEDEERKLKLATNKLKDCVASTMPTLIANFEQESQKILAKKLAFFSVSANFIFVLIIVS